MKEEQQQRKKSHARGEIRDFAWIAHLFDLESKSQNVRTMRA